MNLLVLRVRALGPGLGWSLSTGGALWFILELEGLGQPRCVSQISPKCSYFLAV